MSKFLERNHILLTGAAKGIGVSTLENLLEAGAKVIATDIDVDLLASKSDSLSRQFPCP